MGLTRDSTGINSVDRKLEIKKLSENDKVIALAGNPNVGKSTVFNYLTGMKQHTGNWPGKTVSNAQGWCEFDGENYLMVDIPGTYSLMAHSAEEEVARDFICFGEPDAVIIICDATCLERNLNLVLQILEITENALVCVNLIDEAKRKRVRVDLDKLSDILGIPVAGASARNGQGIDELMNKLKYMTSDKKLSESTLSRPVRKVSYSDAVMKSAAVIEPSLFEICGQKINSHWLSLRLLDADEAFINSVSDFIGFDINMCEIINEKINEAKALYKKLSEKSDIDIRDEIVSSIVAEAERIAGDVVTIEDPSYSERDRKLDRILTGKFTGFPIMAVLLALIFWITITGANYPSAFLSEILFRFEDFLYNLYTKSSFPLPLWIGDLIIHGIYRVLAWVVSVMLPPMAIFFPLFTLLEDLGYLPRVAFNLDNCFKRCNACGKQALTLCMGFGCNSAGVVGCRIIDSPRERLIAVLTNSLVPCNGKFPMIVSLITIFLVGASERGNSVISAVILSMFIVLSIFITLLVSKILSSTILKGIPSSFTLELPPFRPPQIGKIIVRSIFDRTIFILGRAVAVAAPAGAVIWLMANICIGDISLLNHCSSFLDPLGKFIGLDGVILMAFILGFPANEIVIPIAIMAYTAGGTLVEFDSLSALRQLLSDNGWTWITAVSTILFSLMHFPCSTTLITIKKETRSIKWTIAAFLIPTLCGIIICTLFSNIARLFI